MIGPSQWWGLFFICVLLIQIDVAKHVIIKKMIRMLLFRFIIRN